jgi:hypothetical protein
VDCACLRIRENLESCNIRSLAINAHRDGVLADFKLVLPVNVVVSIRRYRTYVFDAVPRRWNGYSTLLAGRERWHLFPLIVEYGS